MSLVSCEAVNTYALELLGAYTDSCLTDRSQCNVGDYNYDSCNCAEEVSSAITTCQDSCAYAFQDYIVQRGTSVGAQTYSINIGSIPTPSYDHNIGFTHYLYQNDQIVGKFTLGFPPAVQVNKLLPALGGSHYAYWNDQLCSVDQAWCNAEQTQYNFYIDCSMYSGGTVLNLCDPPTQLTDQSPLMEVALQVPFLSCSDPSLLGSGGGGGNNNINPENFAPLPEGTNPVGTAPVGTTPVAPATSGGNNPIAMPVGATSGAAAAAGSPAFALVGLLASMILLRSF